MQRTLQALGLLAALLLVGILWLSRRDEGAEPTTDPASAATLPADIDGSAEAQLMAPGGEANSTAPSTLDSARREARPGDAAPDGTVWIDGRVSFPIGSPPDASLAVLAFPLINDLALPPLRDSRAPRWWPDVARLAPDEPTRGPVASDGAFRVLVPPGAGRVLLLLEGRFLYLHRGEVLDVPSPDPVLLEPKLGGVLRVHCLPPDTATDDGAPLAGLELDLHGYEAKAGFSFVGLHRRTAVTDAAHTAEFTALPTHYDYFVLGDPPTYAASRDLGIAIESGQRTDFELRFRFGADYAGRVIDENGAPVAGARVAIAPPDRRMGFGPGTRRATKTNAAGEFSIVGARIGPVVVTAEHEGLRPASSKTLVGKEGGVTNSLELILEAGLTISGRILLPHGTPAPGARVELAPSVPTVVPATDEESSWRRTSADEDGRFWFSGLEDAPYDLAAAASTTEPNAADLRARRNGVAAGTEGIELVLAESASLAGVVVDDEGSPIPAFALELEPEGRPDERFALSCTDADGRFEVPGLHAGPWRLHAEADDHVGAPEGVAFLFPVPAAELVVVLTRASRVSGIVVDADGAVVEDSEIVLTDVGVDSERSPTTGRGLPIADARTAADGSFTLTDIPPGVYEVRADHERYAPLAPQTLDLPPGTRIDDLRLSLAAGGRITGLVFDEAGDPDDGREVSAYSDLVGDASSAVTDAAGRFEMGPLAAGPYMVHTPLSREELEEIVAAGSDLTALGERTRRAEVEVLDGATVHVVLGAPPESPIRVFGRVTEAGAPVTTGSVSIVPADGTFADRKDTKVEPDGWYELALESPGPAVLLYHRQIFRTAALDFPTRVPAGEEFRFDLELPTGSIEGLVLGPDGEPMPGASVTLTRDTGLPRPTFYGPARGGPTKADGTFLLTGLEAGTFSLRIMGRTMRPDVSYGAALLEGIVVREGERTDGLTIRLTGHGTLRGRVLDPDGRPVPTAAIFVHDAEGRRLQLFSPCETDPTGRFVYPGLPDGELFVTARTTTAASEVHGPLRIHADEDTEVELRLTASTLVHVFVEDARGRPQRARVDLFDAADRNHAGFLSIPAFTSGRNLPPVPGASTLGPASPGPYRVRALTEDGRTAEQEVTLGATAASKVHLRLPD